MPKSPVFIVGRFRSGTTLLWSLLRKSGVYTAFYEPLQDNLHALLTAGSKVDESHIGVESYFDEYEVLGEELWKYWKKRFGISRLLMGYNDNDPDLKKYLDYLISQAQKHDRLAALKFVRMDFRLPWLRANYPDAKIIGIIRNPRENWASIVSKTPEELRTNANLNTGYDLVVWSASLGSAMPWLISKDIRNSYERAYFLWKASTWYLSKYCDILIDYDRDVIDKPELFIEKFSEATDVPGNGWLNEISVANNKKWKAYEKVIDFDSSEKYVDQVISGLDFEKFTGTDVLKKYGRKSCEFELAAYEISRQRDLLIKISFDASEMESAKNKYIKSLEKQAEKKDEYINSIENALKIKDEYAESILKEFNKKEKYTDELASILEEQSIQIKNLENLLSEKQESFKVLHKKFVQLKLEISSLKQSLEVKNREIISINELLKNKNDIISELNKKFKQSLSQQESLKNGIEEKEKLLLHFRKSFEESEKYVNSLSESLTKKNEYINSLEDALKNKSAEVQHIKSVLDKKNEEISNLTKSVEEKERYIESMEQEFSNYKEDSQNRLKDLSDKIQRQVFEISSFREKVKYYDSEIKNYKKKMRYMKAEIASLGSFVDVVDKTLTGSKIKQNKGDANLEDLVGKVMQLESIMKNPFRAFFFSLKRLLGIGKDL